MAGRVFLPLLALHRRLLAAVLLCLLVPAALADIAVIVHPDSPLRTIGAREVSDLYLGRNHSVSVDGQRIAVVALEQPAGSPLREAFFRALNGMRIQQVNAYWARLRFSGEVLPPTALPDSRAVVDAVARSRHAIGYVEAAAVNDSVRTVLLLKE